MVVFIEAPFPDRESVAYAELGASGAAGDTSGFAFAAASGLELTHRGLV